MLINKEDLPLVDKASMNETHFDDIDLINKLNDLIEEFENNPSDELFYTLEAHYTKWFEHTIKHFGTEEQMMQEKGFPAYAVHKQEHDNVLSAMKKIHEDLKKTRSAAGVKNFVQNGLVRWLITHIQTMDTVTARFLEGKISLNQAIN